MKFFYLSFVKIIIVILLCMQLSPAYSSELNLNKEEKEWLKNQKEIKLGVWIDVPPYSFKDENNNLSGMAPDYIKLIENSINKKFTKIIFKDFASAWKEYLDSNLDMLISVTPNKERKRLSLFSKTYSKIFIVLINRKDYPHVNTLEDYNNKTIACVKEHISVHLLKKYNKKINIIETENHIDGLRLVSEGKVDGFVSSMASATWKMREQEITNLKIAFKTDYQFKTCFAIRKDWPLLKTILDKAIDGVEVQKRNEILNKWIKIENSTIIDLKNFWKIVLIIILIFILFFIWNRKLKYEIQLKEKAEKALKTSEEKYRLLTDSTFEGIIIHQNSIPDDFNNSYAKMFGYDRKELENVNQIELLICEKDHEKVYNNIKENYQLPYEVTGIKKDGTEFPLEIVGKTIHKNGNTFRVTALRDITERKESEIYLKNSEERFRDLVNSIDSGIAVYEVKNDGLNGDDYIIKDFNNFSLKHENLKREDVFGKSLKDIRPNIDDYGLIETFRKVWKTGTPEFFPAKIYRDDKYANYYENRVFRLPSMEIVAIYNDVTKSKLIEEELKLEKERAEQYLRIAGVMFVGIDKYGIVNLVNDRACEVLEFKREQIIGKNWFNNFLPKNIKDEVFSVFEQIIDENKILPEYYENPINSKSGKEKIIAWQNIALKDSENKITGILCSGQEITLQKQLENQIQQQQKIEAIGTLAGGIAHDFNNMLSIISGNVSILEKIYENDKETSELLSNISVGVIRAKSLTKQLITFSKGGEPVRKPVNINKFIKESANFSLSGTKLKCLYDLRNETLISEIDSDQMNQVIGNILINSNQAMPDGGEIIIRTEISEIDAKTKLILKPDKYIKISIKDKGVGISKDHLHKIFDPYYSTKKEGSGLGLASSYSIVKKHGGLITIESELHKGTTVFIYLPYSEKSIENNKVNKKSNHSGSGKILIMDDEEMILKVLSLMLKQLGYEVIKSRDGIEAVEIYKRYYDENYIINLVMLDLTVPGGVGGAKVLPELRKINPDVKVIVSSGYSSDPILANYESYGFDNVIEKPYDFNELSKMLEKFSH